MQEGIPAVEDFLVTYLKTWNGVRHRESLLKLMSCLRIQPFEGSPVAEYRFSLNLNVWDASC